MKDFYSYLSEPVTDLESKSSSELYELRKSIRSTFRSVIRDDLKKELTEILPQSMKDMKWCCSDVSYEYAIYFSELSTENIYIYYVDRDDTFSIKFGSIVSCGEFHIDGSATEQEQKVYNYYMGVATILSSDTFKAVLTDKLKEVYAVTSEYVKLKDAISDRRDALMKESYENDLKDWFENKWYAAVVKSESTNYVRVFNCAFLYDLTYRGRKVSPYGYGEVDVTQGSDVTSCTKFVYTEEEKNEYIRKNKYSKKDFVKISMLKLNGQWLKR